MLADKQSFLGQFLPNIALSVPRSSMQMIWRQRVGHIFVHLQFLIGYFDRHWPQPYSDFGDEFTITEVLSALRNA